MLIGEYIMPATMSQLICHSMIIFISPKFFILYSYTSNFFNASRMLIVFDAKRKSSIYMLIILISSLNQ